MPRHQRASPRPVCNYRHEAWPPRRRTIGPLPRDAMRSGTLCFRPFTRDPFFPFTTTLDHPLWRSDLQPTRRISIELRSLLIRVVLGAKEFPFGRYKLSRPLWGSPSLPLSDGSKLWREYSTAFVGELRFPYSCSAGERARAAVLTRFKLSRNLIGRARSPSRFTSISDHCKFTRTIRLA